MEKVLREARVIFHSFKPADTNKFRKAVLGQNKNNERDAESAARNVVFYDPDSHLAGYSRNLVKAGMQPLEATKRAARALVRVIFR